MEKKFSVVLPVLLPSREHLSMTMKCINLARTKTSIPFDLVIVESGSQHLIDEADIYVYEKNVTTPEIGHNLGFKVADGDYITLLTNDVFISEGWLEKLYECFENRKDCGASTLASTQFNHTKEEKIEEGNWFSVAMFEKKLFERIGYYDERFRNSWCDTDLLVRMYKIGLKMYRNFGCVVEHLVGATNYQKEGFKKDYEDGRKLFNEKHEGCELPIYEMVR